MVRKVLLAIASACVLSAQGSETHTPTHAPHVDGNASATHVAHTTHAPHAGVNATMTTTPSATTKHASLSDLASPQAAAAPLACAVGALAMAASWA
mmetsp:Transcript_104268/g.301659  ORF Transcript_104268/g.301659 Transcript_104268/m.301659 type:complete len:96 (-) Transcript_104268:65-352(-)